MKIKTKTISYQKAAAMPRPKHLRPHRANFFWRTLVYLLSSFSVLGARVKTTGKLPKKDPHLVLMNHCSFIDLKIAAKMLYPRPFGIIATHDALVGKRWLMRRIGCVSTKKFVSEVSLISDMRYLLSHKSSVLLYPEAGYSLHGKATVLPKKFGRLIKMLGAPVAFIETQGAFTREPLYCALKTRKVPVTADLRVLLSKEEVASLSVEEIDRVIEKAFSFDYFTWQKEAGVRVTESFRAEGLERILYRCTDCEKEGTLLTKGDPACGKTHRFTELGELRAEEGETRFSHLPDWYEWQRQTVKEEIESGTYRLHVPVEIGMMFDFKAFYRVGSGTLTHDRNGFTLTGCDGALHYEQPPHLSYTLNADYFWYEQGDVIGIGNLDTLYYCFPPKGISVTKARLAAEELYKLSAKK